MKLLIKQGRIIDPQSGLDLMGDVAVNDDRIVALGQAPADFTPDQVIDANGCVIAPGLVDLAVRLREPGHEQEGMLESELAAAAAGGVTSVVCLPDTDPVLDEPGLVEMLKLRARKLSRCRLFPLGALTRGLQGEALTEMAELTEAGCIGFSQAEVAVKDTLVLQRAMQYASTYGYTVWLRPQDPWLGKGIAASGPVATRLGLSGVPVSAETIALLTIVELVRATQARVHVCRLSSAAGVDIVRRAKAEGLPITADVSINSLHLTDMDIGFFDPAMRLSPPLRQARDRDALQAGVADGTIDAVVSDHMPVKQDEKLLPFAEATPGATGLELLLSLSLKAAGLLDAVSVDKLDGALLQQALRPVTCGPARVLGSALGSHAHSAGRLMVGAAADLCVFDPAVCWQVDSGTLVSQGRYTPFAFERTGTALPGRVASTLIAGQIAYQQALAAR